MSEAESSTTRTDPNIRVWLKQLKDLYPHIPENLLLHILKTYDEKPHIIDAIVEEDKKSPIKPKERPEIQPTYNCVEVIKDDEKNEHII